MKICVFGAGAVGGYLAVKLAHAGQDVSVVARGAHLEAIRGMGLTLQQGGKTLNARPAASAEPAALGAQDYVFLAVKSPALPEAARAMAPLLGPDTAVVTAMNGIPWWFFHDREEKAGPRLDAIDPGGVLARFIPPARIIGCVLHIACSVPAPGMIVHNNQNRFLFGELDGSESPRLARLVEAAVAAGLDAEARRDIRHDVWVKLLGNLCYAPVSALTGSTNDRLAKDPLTRRIMTRMIEEANEVGRRFGLVSDMSVELRIDLGGSLVGFRTSMLQDLDKGRAVELDTIVRVVSDMGRAAGVATPVIDAVYGLAAHKAVLAGLYNPW